MPELKQCEFFLLRYVPDVLREEFVNIGLVFREHREKEEGFAEVRFARDWQRVRCLDSGADIEVLQALEKEFQGQIGRIVDRESLLRKLHDSYSNTLQISSTKACLTENPAMEVERLVRNYLDPAPISRASRLATGRQAIVAQMRDAFERAGVWELMRKNIRATKYTNKGDPLKIDCGYRPNGVLKLFQAMSLNDPDSVKVLAFSYPQLVAGIRRVEHAETDLTAVVEHSVDRNTDAVAFAEETLEQNRIRVAVTSDLMEIAAKVRRELIP